MKSSFAFIVYSIQNAPGRILHFKSFLDYEFNHSLNKDFNSLDWINTTVYSMSIVQVGLIFIMFLDKPTTVYRLPVYKVRKILCQKDIHFKTQPEPVAKNATPRTLAGN